MSDRELTAVEAVSAAVVVALASLIGVAYLWARLTPISPFALLGFTLAVFVLAVRRLWPRAAADAAGSIAAAVVAILVAAWLLRLAWPALLVPGGGPDLTHHFQLADYIERHWRLPDASHLGVMNEMAHYTPGVHLAAALAGAWTRSDAFHLIYPVLVLAVALKCALVFAITLRLLPGTAVRLPAALASVALALSAQAYFLGSFVRDSFWAQVFAELFAVAMWWALVVWDEPSPAPPGGRKRVALLLFGAAGAAVFLSWPVWIGPPVVALTAAVLVRGDVRVTDRVRDLAVALAPIALVAAIHAFGRVGWLGMAGTSGAVLRPSLDAIGWPLAIAGAVGILAALTQRRARTTLLLTLAIVVQGATLYAVARSAGASTPYMAFKMMYLLIYPLAVLGALAAGVLAAAAERRGFRHAGLAAAALLFVLVAGYRRPLFEVRPPAPIVSEDLYAAGRWIRSQVESACVDYLVPHADTAYWLHLAVLGNPRATPRTANPDTFDPKSNLARWIQPDGLPYAVVHLPALPNEIRGDVDILETFGTAAVVKRRGPSFCADAQRFARLTP